MKFRLLAIALLTAFAAFSLATDSADVMLTKIKAIKSPTFDRTKASDPSYMPQYYAEVNKTNEERGKLILEFYKAYPDNEDAEKLLNTRWASLGGAGHRITHEIVVSIDADIDSIVNANAPAQVKQDGSFWKARYGMVDESNNAAAVAKLVDSFTNSYPTDPRGAQLIGSEAERQGTSKQDRRALYLRLIMNYKDAPSAKYAPGIVRQEDSIGKPFDLTFTDAVSGKPISIKDLKGKVVILDFWATWCGPCIAKMPEMKKLYADMHDKGLEVLGISLDQPENMGGLTKLKDYVAKNDVPWPQYYQGNFWSSEFSTSWGINSIPCVFLIDKNGNLAEVTYPEKLDEKVKKLLGN